MKKLNPAYHQTVFEYIPAGKPDDFWVITAYNPKGSPADPGDNLAADTRILADLTRLKITPFRIIGLSPDVTHAEPGWGFPSDEATALEIGRRYQQDALYHFTAGRIDLVDCETQERHPLENPATRIRDPREVRHFTLFVGSPAGRNRFDPLEYAGVCTRVGAAKCASGVAAYATLATYIRLCSINQATACDRARGPQADLCPQLRVRAVH